MVIRDVDTGAQEVHVGHRWVQYSTVQYSIVQYSTVQYSTVQYSVQVGVVVQYSASRLRDFTGVLEQREHSHTHLNLSLVGAAGTITGTVAGQQV